MSPIVINVQTRGLLAVETNDSFVMWLANLNIKTVSIAIYILRNVKP